MANKPLQSIKFPDLPDTYTVPVVDSTLAVSGAAADAKKTGDKLAKKVDAVSGKGLSTNDFTTTEKNKLSGIESGANKTVIDSTLAISGNAADAKAVGDALADVDRNAYGAYIVPTATGSIAHFEDGADNIPMKDVLVHIEPVQAGSGDPSPDNVRQITGWTGAKVTRTGKNLWMFNDSYSTSKYTILLNRVPFNLYPGTYTFSAVPNIEADSVVLFGYHEDGTRTEIARLNASTTRSFSTATVNKPVVSLYFIANAGGTISNIQLELGSTATAYEPYHADTYDITFPSSAGTVYGGTLDVTSGVLTVDRAIIASYAGETLPSTWISDRDVYSAGATPTTGAQVCYKLATPITYHLTPQEITSLLGENNVWADTGDSDVQYRADTKMYVDAKVAAAVSALS